MTPKLLKNCWQTPDGTILHSKYQHDFVDHNDKNGKYYAVDGGNSYIRLIGDKNDLKDLCLYSNDDFKKLREELTWGSYGKDGKAKLKLIAIKDLENEHILNIFRTQKSLSKEFKALLLEELVYRL